MKKVINLKRYNIYIGSFVLALAGICVIMAIIGVAPFGNKSILLWDMDIQYVQFFCWLKDVLQGNTKIGYSFLKSLGGSMTAMFGYYLSSPFNFLVILFEKQDMQLCLTLITVLKVATCGLTCSIFLKNRFRELNTVWIMGLSCSYAFSQYVISQMSNIMWLDGVYMLPIIMLGVYKFTSQNKKVLLCSSVTLGIIFNWYTGYMNCLFIPFYFLYEYIVHADNKVIKDGRKFAKKILAFLMYEALAVLLTMFFFLPVIMGLRSGKGAVEENVFRFAVNGQFLDILRGFVIGSPGNSPDISFFCGTLIVLGVCLFFCSRTIKNIEKYTGGIMLMFLVASVYFKPLENVWNGFRYAYSYMYRFSYIVILWMIFLCAKFICNAHREKQNFRVPYLIRIISFCVAILLILDAIEPFEAKRMWGQIAILIGIAFIIKNATFRKNILVFILFSELLLNGVMVAKDWYWMDADTYKNYVETQQKQIQDIKAYNGSSFIRTARTLNRKNESDRNKARFTENLMFGYSSVGHYNSAFDKNVADFISELGYSDVRNIIVYDEPILASDSLLGIRYLMADREYPGWDRIEDIAEANGKCVYENKYALPLGMKVENKLYDKITEQNPFLYQNQLFSAIIGKEIELFKPIPVEKQMDSEGILYYVDSLKKNGIVYCYGRFNNPATELTVYVNDQYACEYQQKKSHLARNLVFNVGNVSEKNKILIKGLDAHNLKDEIQVYYLDMELFESAIKELKNRQPELINVTDKKVVFNVNADSDMALMTTIPFDEGWSVSVNGSEGKVQENMGIFMQIPLVKGDNEIELIYHPQGYIEGMAVSLIALSICGIIGFYKRLKRNQ